MDLIHFFIDFILHIDKHLDQMIITYGIWVYVILFLIVFCETGLVVTPFLPGDSMLFVAGALAARATNELDVVILCIVLVVAAIIGDSSNFEIGKIFGEKLFSNPNSKIFKQEYLHKTHEFYKKYGGKTIILARFVPIVRTFAPFVAGMGRMHYYYFISYNVIGGLAWVLIFTLAGYFVGNVEWVQSNLKLLIVAIILVSILPAVFEVVKNKIKSKKFENG
jgi:membrane-associated protein